MAGLQDCTAGYNGRRCKGGMVGGVHHGADWGNTIREGTLLKHKLLCDEPTTLDERLDIADKYATADSSMKTELRVDTSGKEQAAHSGYSIANKQANNKYSSNAQVKFE